MSILWHTTRIPNTHCVKRICQLHKSSSFTTLSTYSCSKHIIQYSSVHQSVRKLSQYINPSHNDINNNNNQSDAERAVNNLLYNIPAPGPTASRRILSLLVANENGVLSRVSGILAGRGFNIESLVVSSTEVPILSRMTVVLDGNTTQVEQARRQLEDLPQIWAAVEFPSNTPIVERELLLVKISTRPNTDTNFNNHLSGLLSVAQVRSSLTELTQMFGGKVVDITPTHMMIELTGKTSRIDAFIGLVRPYGIVELARTGALAVARGNLDESIYGPGIQSNQHSNNGNARLNPKKSSMVDEASLPPG